MLAELYLTVQILSADIVIDKKGRTTTTEKIVYVNSVVPYPTVNACMNAKEEFTLAFGAYQMATRPTKIVSAICTDERGTVQ